MIEANIKIKVNNVGTTFFSITGEGIAYEIAAELLKLAANSDMETFTGKEIIKEKMN